jgi:hypothetical protein
MRLVYNLTEKEQENQGDIARYEIIPSIMYRLTEDIDLRLSYSYGLRENLDDDNSENRNQFALQISQSFEKLFD